MMNICSCLLSYLVTFSKKMIQIRNYLKIAKRVYNSCFLQATYLWSVGWSFSQKSSESLATAQSRN